MLRIKADSHSIINPIIFIYTNDLYILINFFVLPHTYMHTTTTITITVMHIWYIATICNSIFCLLPYVYDIAHMYAHIILVPQCVNLSEEYNGKFIINTMLIINNREYMK